MDSGEWYLPRCFQPKRLRAGLGNELDIDILFSPETEVSIYRIFQEAMTNITRHAEAKTISVSIRKQKRSISFLVEDDGVGFSVEKVTAAGSVDQGLGLVAMDERIRMIEGKLEIFFG